MMMRFRIPTPEQLTPFCGSSSESLATWPDGSIAEYVTAEGTEKRPFKKKVIDTTKSRKRKGQHSPPPSQVVQYRAAKKEEWGDREPVCFYVPDNQRKKGEDHRKYY